MEFPYSEDTQSLKQQSGQIILDLGPIVQIQGELNNKHGLDIDNNSIYESVEDINMDYTEGEFLDDAVSETSLTKTDEDEEMVVDSLVGALGPRPIEPIDPVIKETEELV